MAGNKRGILLLLLGSVLTLPGFVQITLAFVLVPDAWDHTPLYFLEKYGIGIALALPGGCTIYAQTAER
jgi:hypothetical protein